MRFIKSPPLLGFILSSALVSSAMLFRFAHETDISSMFRYVRLLKRENAFSYVAHLIESLCTRSFHQAAMMPDRSDILRFLKHRRRLSLTELSVSIVSLLTIWLKIVYNVFPFVFYASSPIWIRLSLIHI